MGLKFLVFDNWNNPPAIVVERDPNGHVTKVTGVFVPILEWLSLDLNFM